MVCQPLHNTPEAGTTITADTEVTLTVSDGTNSTSCTFMVELDDTTTPSLTACPATQTVMANEVCEVMLADYTTTVTASDNCDASPTITQSPIAGTAITESTVVMLTATDEGGNATSCTFTVEVEDNSPPTAFCPREEISDQVNDIVPSNSSIWFKVNSGIRHAWSFTAGVTGNLTRIESEINTSLGFSGTTTLTLTIIDGNDPNPPNPVLGTASFMPSGADLNFVFPSPIPVTAGQELTMVFSSPDGFFYLNADFHDTYPGNIYWLNDSGTFISWFAADLDFTTYVEVAGELPEVCLDESGMGSLTADLIDQGSFDNCTAQEILT